MWLIAGLGNPGPKYENTRHNLGFMVLDLLAGRWGIPTEKNRGAAAVGRGRYLGEEILLVKPLAYMNRSGPVLASFVEREGLSMPQVLVLVDDLDLPLGTVRYRPKGGSAGHRGMESIVDSLGSSDFHRIRMGIGRPQLLEENVPYVLSGFNDEEIPVVNRMTEAAADLVAKIISEGEMEPVTLNLFRTLEEEL